MTSEIKPLLDQRYQTLEKLELTQQNMQEKIQLIKSQIYSAENELQTTLAANSLKTTGLKEALALQQQITHSLEIKLQETESFHRNLEARTAFEGTALGELQQEFNCLEQESAELMAETTQVSSKVTGLVQKLRNLVRLSDLKQLVCPKCYDRLKHNVEMTISSHSRRMAEDRDEHTCKRCLVF